MNEERIPDWRIWMHNNFRWYWKWSLKRDVAGKQDTRLMKVILRTYYSLVGAIEKICLLAKHSKAASNG